MGYPLQYSWASLVAQLVKICLQCERPGFDPWVGKIPWRRERLPTPVFWPGDSMNCIVHGVTKSRTRLSDFHFHNSIAMNKASGGDGIPAELFQILKEDHGIWSHHFMANRWGNSGNSG